jgi:hypothetical protein
MPARRCVFPYPGPKWGGAIDGQSLIALKKLAAERALTHYAYCQVSYRTDNINKLQDIKAPQGGTPSWYMYILQLLKLDHIFLLYVSLLHARLATYN